MRQTLQIDETSIQYVFTPLMGHKLFRLTSTKATKKNKKQFKKVVDVNMNLQVYDNTLCNTSCILLHPTIINNELSLLKNAQYKMVHRLEQELDRVRSQTKVVLNESYDEVERLQQQNQSLVASVANLEAELLSLHRVKSQSMERSKRRIFQLDVDMKTQPESKLLDKNAEDDDNSRSVTSDNSFFRSILDNSSEKINSIRRSFTKQKSTSDIALQQFQARILDKECTLEDLKLKSHHKEAKMDSLARANHCNEVTLRTVENKNQLLRENRENRLLQWKQTLRRLKKEAEQIALQNALKREKLEELTMQLQMSEDR